MFEEWSWEGPAGDDTAPLESQQFQQENAPHAAAQADLSTSTASSATARSIEPPAVPPFGNIPVSLIAARHAAAAGGAPPHASHPTLASLAHLTAAKRTTPRGAVALAGGERLPLHPLAQQHHQHIPKPQYRVSSLFGKAVVQRVLVASSPSSPSPAAPSPSPSSSPAPAASAAALSPARTPRGGRQAARGTAGSASASFRSPLPAYLDPEVGMMGPGASVGATAVRLPPTPPPYAMSGCARGGAPSLSSSRGARVSPAAAAAAISSPVGASALRSSLMNSDIEAGGLPTLAFSSSSSSSSSAAAAAAAPPTAASYAYASPQPRRHSPLVAAGPAPTAAGAPAASVSAPPAPPAVLSPERLTRFRPMGRADPVTRWQEMGAAWGAHGGGGGGGGGFASASIRTPSPVAAGGGGGGWGVASPPSRARDSSSSASSSSSTASQEAITASVLAILASHGLRPEDCGPEHPLWPKIKTLLAPFAAKGGKTEVAARVAYAGAAEHHQQSRGGPFRNTTLAPAVAPRRGGAPA